MTRFPIFDGESKSAKILDSHFGWGEGTGTQFPTFDAESKSAEIPNSHFGWGESQIPILVGGWGKEELGPNFQLLMLSPNLLKSQIPSLVVGGGGRTQLSKVNFKHSNLSSMLKFSISGMGLVTPLVEQWNAWNLVLPQSIHLG